MKYINVRVVHASQTRQYTVHCKLFFQKKYYSQYATRSINQSQSI